MQPDLPGAHYRLGRMILGTGDTQENDKLALEEFRKELTIQSDDVPTLLEIGEIDLRAQRLDEAEKGFSQALALQSGSLRGMIGLSKVYLARKQYERALVELQGAARIAADDANVHYNLMLAYRSLGRASDAQIEYAQFQRLKTSEQQRKSSLLNQLKGLPGSKQSSQP